MFTYGQGFDETQMGGAAHSASAMVLIVPGILPARSVRGVGCGVGTRPNAFARYCISGLPGPERDDVNCKPLPIPAGQVQAV